MKKKFKQDAARWITPQQIADLNEVTLLKTIKLLWNHMPLQAMLFYRTGRWLKQKKVPLLPGIIQRFIYVIYGLEISVSQDVGGGLYIAHPIGTVISVEKMGQNCTIIANVTIGMRNDWAFPRISDDVFIGAGARVLGGIEIGDGAVIGANAVVITDIPAGGTAVGIPARVIKIKGKRVEPDAEEAKTAEPIL